MTLKELIVWLESKDPKLVLSRGFNQPHSYRGIYADVAFVPCKDASVAEMLRDAKSALGETFGGWKGGEFEMNEWTGCWLAEIGDTGDAITRVWLEAESALTALRERLATAEASYQEAQLTIAGLESERDHYRDALAAMTEKLDALFEEATALKRSHAELEKQLAQLREWHGAACKTMQDYVRNAERHAADVEAAFRAGYSAGGDDMSAAHHNEYYVGEDAAWLASEAKARLI